MRLAGICSTRRPRGRPLVAVTPAYGSRKEGFSVLETGSRQGCRSVQARAARKSQAVVAFAPALPCSQQAPGMLRTPGLHLPRTTQTSAQSRCWRTGLATSLAPGLRLWHWLALVPGRQRRRRLPVARQQGRGAATQPVSSHRLTWRGEFQNPVGLASLRHERGLSVLKQQGRDFSKRRTCILCRHRGPLLL